MLSNIKKLFVLTITLCFLNITFAQCDIPENTLGLDGGSVLYNTVEPIAGFQFNVEGASVSGASGGDAAASGFTVSAGGSTVLGFSFSGATIPAGCGTLVDLSTDGDPLALSSIIISNSSGEGLDFSFYEGGVQLSCEDESACNFMEVADCIYPEDNLIAMAIVLRLIVQVHAGDAIVDECGECGGDGLQPGYDCDGNFVLTTVQVIHNSASPTVDVYVDGALAVEDFAYRTATPLLTLPTTFTVGIAPADGDVIAEFPFELMEGGSYVVVATGLLGDDVTPFDLAAAGTTFGASSSDVVGLEVYHGSTDAPAVDIWADDAPLLTDFSYGDFSGFVEVPAADYVLGVAPAGGDIIAAFTAPLSGLGGGSAVAFASGFLSGDDPAFGLFAALNDGTVLALPVYEEDDSVIESGCDLPLNNLYVMGSSVLYNSDVDIAGFQFDVEGADVSGASGGDAAASGFTVSAGGTTVLGFSFSGATISAGCGTLTNLDLNGAATSLFNIIVSNSSGEGVDFAYYDGDNGGGNDDIYGCTDPDACNYNPDANMDDGSYTGPYLCDDGETLVCDLNDCPGDGTVEGITLSVMNSQSDAGSQGSVMINMANDESVGGFQFVLSDLPDLLSYVDVALTDRTASANFTVSANEGEQGVIALGFSLTGGTIPAGDGPIVEIIYNAEMVDFDTDVNLSLSGAIISDPLGNSVDSELVDGTFTIVAAPLAVPGAPQNVVANGGQNLVTVSWDSVFQAQGYHVWRDGSIIAEVNSTSYTDVDLDNETTYCYLVTAFNIEGESEPSSEACGTTLPEYTGPPMLSVGSASIDAGDVFDIEVSLANPGDAVAGIQVQILDVPDHLEVNDVIATDRLDGFTLSFNEQADGSVLLLHLV